MIKGPSLGVFDFGRGPGFPYPVAPVIVRQPPSYVFPVTVEEQPIVSQGATAPNWVVLAGVGVLGIVAGLIFAR